MIRSTFLTALLASATLLAPPASAQETNYPKIGSALQPQTFSPFIIVDQFGYRPEMLKMAILRDPQKGFDADQTYTPADSYALINTATGEIVMTLRPQQHNNGAVDPASGDVTWSLDFSTLMTAGNYVIEDSATGARSAEFAIGTDVYELVLKQAVRTMYYQRAGYPKEAPFADPRWADRASHIGRLQDRQARLFSSPRDKSTERDLSGGWYDAGDYNKYTSWTARYVIYMMHAWLDNPEAWADDYDIPESGNGIPDLIDEAIFGLDWVVRMQNEDGSVLSIVGLDHGTPPSAAKGQSLYGPANTSATLTSAAAYALSAHVLPMVDPRLKDRTAPLITRAEAAWDWAEENPDVIFKNNDAEFNSQGLGAGQQEVDDRERARKKLSAAIYLYAATGAEKYQDYVEKNIAKADVVQSRWASPYESEHTTAILYYTTLPGVPERTINTVHSAFLAAMQGDNAFGAVANTRDGYYSWLNEYVWGSNTIKARMGLLFTELDTFGIGDIDPALTDFAAAGYIHYIHGVNPLGKVYLSNMGEYGAENSVDEFYHTWFQHEDRRWGSVSGSEFGPAPGFLVGGPNAQYDRDQCCPNSCGTPQNNARCLSQRLSPPYGQPPAKAYRDFSDNWPLNSWSVTENSNGYQLSYIRLLGHFVD